MRHYKLTITPPNGKPLVFESQLSGRGLNIEFQLPTTPLDSATGEATIKIYNVPLDYIGNSFDFVGCGIELSGGMAKGLPVCKPEQQGVLCRGQIFAVMPTWSGTTQFLQFTIISQSNTPNAPLITGAKKLNDENPVFYVLDWKVGQELKDALMTSLSRIHPKEVIKIAIKDGLKLGYDSHGQHYTLLSLASRIKTLTAAPQYSGVSIAIENGLIVVSDGTQKPKDKRSIKINLSDLIGQATIMDNGEKVGFRTVLRGDIGWYDEIILPEKMLTTTSPTAGITVRDKFNFNGTYQVVAKTHIGHYRSASAEDWITYFECYKNGN